MPTLEIEYCVPCGFRSRALEVASALLQNLEREVDELVLRTGDHGVFVVRVDDAVVFDVADDEFDVDAIVRAARDRF